MRKTYKCSNIKFCMENDSQREHLQKMTRKDGSYGKILSDAFVASRDFEMTRADKTGAIKGFPVSVQRGWDAGQMAGELERVLDAKLQTMQEILTEQIERCFREYMLSPADIDEQKETVSGGVPGQMQDPEMSEDMMAFAFAMGE